MSQETDEWTDKDFSRRRYSLDFGKDLPAGSEIRVTMVVPGEKPTKLVLREPGIISFISPVNEDGIHIDIVQPGGGLATDITQDDGTPVDPTIEDWQASLLGLRK